MLSACDPPAANKRAINLKVILIPYGGLTVCQANPGTTLYTSYLTDGS